MADHLRVVKAKDAPAELGGFVATETAEDMLRSLRLIRVQKGVRMTMIAGAPGTGKTTAVARFASEVPEAIHVTAVRGEGSIYTVADLLLEVWGQATRNRTRTDVRRNLIDNLAGTGAALLIDEAQHVEADALEWVRAMCEEARVDLALIGDHRLAPAVQAIPQLWSRMRRPVIVRRPTTGDVAGLARAAGVTDAPSIRALTAVALRDGALRNVESVLDLAALFAGGGAIGTADLRAAIADMKLGTVEALT